MDMQTEQTPKLPIKRELIRVRKADSSPLPLEGHGIHHFQHLHDRYLHEVDGEDCYECPLDVLALHCAKHQADLPRLTMLLDIAANRGLHHHMDKIRAGCTDPAQVFYIAEHVEKDEQDRVILREPAQAFVTTAEGKTVLPLPIHDVAMLLGEHHHFASTDIKHESKGGEKSAGAISAMEEFLAEVGLKPNHPVIRGAFCGNCNKGGAA